MELWLILNGDRIEYKLEKEILVIWTGQYTNDLPQGSVINKWWISL